MSYKKIQNYINVEGIQTSISSLSSSATAATASIDWLSSSMIQATASIVYIDGRVTQNEVDIVNLSSQVSASTPGAVLLVTPTTSTKYDTIADALAAATEGNVVEVGAGIWEESFTIPYGVRMVGVDTAVTIISGSSSTGRRITMDTKSSIEKFSINLPNDASEAVYYSGSQTCPCTKIANCYFYGQSNTDSYAIRHAGSSLLVVEDCHLISGSCYAFGSNEGAGTLRIDSSQIEGTAKTTTRVINAISGSVRLRDFYAGKGSCRTFVYVESASLNANDIGCSGSQTGIHIAGENARMNVLGYFAESNSLYDFVVDSGFSSSPHVYISGDFDKNKVFYDHSYDDVVLVYTDDTSGDQSFCIEGELNIGRAEKGSEAIFGEGDSYTRGMIVLTTDDSADATTDGGNLTDVSTVARVLDDNTFTFQGATAGYSILLGSSLTGSSVTGSTDYLKHWGFKMANVLPATKDAAKAASSSSFEFERWDGSAWTSMGVMATHSNLFYRYANEVFIRATASEHVRYGIDRSDAWEKKTIDGKNLFWSRIRIRDDLTQAPTFRQFKLHSSRTEANPDGTMTYHGLARYRGTLLAAGNVFGESGGVIDSSVTVGAGSSEPTTWTHVSPNSTMNGNGDAIYTQFVLPRGIDTSFPLRVIFNYSVAAGASVGATDVKTACSIYPAEVIGNLQAHPSGSTYIQVERVREDCETLTAKVATVVSGTLNVDSTGQVYQHKYQPFPISNYYEGDELFLRLELDNDGASNADINVHSVEIKGVMWTGGAKL